MQQTPFFPLRQTHLTLLASSSTAAHAFYKTALFSNPALRVGGHSCIESEEGVHARIRDRDGNMLDAVYSRGLRRGPYPPPPALAENKESRRVLEWQQNVARSVAAEGTHSPASSVSGSASPSVIRDSRPPVSYRRAESYPSPVSQIRDRDRERGEPPMRLVRRDTITTERYRRDDDARSRTSGTTERGSMGGLKMAAGTLLGAAAGAAVAYAMVTAGSPSSKTRDTTTGSATGTGRHAALRRASYDTPARTTVVERIPARSSRSYVQEPQYVAQYTMAPRIKEREEERSGVSVRTGRSGKHGARERSRSESGSRYEIARPTVTLLPTRTRSPGSYVSGRSQHSRGKGDREGSYVGPRGGEVRYEYTNGLGRTLGGHDRDLDRRSSVSTRTIEARAPRSVLGSVVGGYAGSVAPSDSVSSVGMKMERERERDRLRDRMRERW